MEYVCWPAATARWFLFVYDGSIEEEEEEVRQPLKRVQQIVLYIVVDVYILYTKINTHKASSCSTMHVDLSLSYCKKKMCWTLISYFSLSSGCAGHEERPRGGKLSAPTHIYNR
jgi:hypothetical protein